MLQVQVQAVLQRTKVWQETGRRPLMEHLLADYALFQVWMRVAVYLDTISGLIDASLFVLKKLSSWFQMNEFSEC